MKLLLDTHVFIWWANDPEKLSKKAFNLCIDSSNTLVLSIASVWEMQIKVQLEKIKLHLPIQELIDSQRDINDLEILDINLNHVMGLNDLPVIHNDPFDRLLIAQANTENFPLISKDNKVTQYPVECIW